MPFLTTWPIVMCTACRVSPMLRAISDGRTMFTMTWIMTIDSGPVSVGQPRACRLACNPSSNHSNPCSKGTIKYEMLSMYSSQRAPSGQPQKA